MEIEEGPRRGVQVVFSMPIVESEQLGEIAQAVGERKAALLRSIIHASLTKLMSMEKPAVTLGDVENAIMK